MKTGSMKRAVYRWAVVLLFFSISTPTLLCVPNPIEEAFYTMPDSLCPYFSYSQKQTLIGHLQLALISRKPVELKTVTNRFGTESTALELTYNMLRLQVTEGVECVWWVGKDEIVFIQTLCAPVCASVATLYDKEWNYMKRLLPDETGIFMKAEVKDDTLVWTDETPLILDDEEKKHYKQTTGEE